MSSPPPVTDSPWFWICLFGTFGLVMLVAMDAKYAQRQAQIERQYQGRTRAAQQRAGETPSTPMSTRHQTQITLKPLYPVLAMFVLAGWILFWWARLRPGMISSHSIRKTPLP